MMCIFYTIDRMTNIVVCSAQTRLSYIGKFLLKIIAYVLFQVGIELIEVTHALLTS